MTHTITKLPFFTLSILLSLNAFANDNQQTSTRFNNEQELIAAMTPNADALPDLSVLAQDVLQQLEQQFQVDQPDAKCQAIEQSFLELYKTVAIDACDYLAQTNQLWAMGTQGMLSLYKLNPNVDSFRYFVLHQAAHHFALQRVLASHDKVILKLCSQACTCDVDKSFANITRSRGADIYVLQVDYHNLCIPGIEIRNIPTLIYFKNGQLLGTSDYNNEELLRGYIKVAFDE